MSRVFNGKRPGHRAGIYYFFISGCKDKNFIRNLQVFEGKTCITSQSLAVPGGEGDLDSETDGGHERATALEFGTQMVLGTTDVMIGIEDVLAIERHLQIFAVAVLHAEVDEQRGRHEEVLFLSELIVQLATGIGGMAVKLQLMVLRLNEFIGPMKIEREVGNTRHHFLTLIIVVIIGTEILAIIKRQIGRGALMGISQATLKTDVGKRAHIMLSTDN